jgi:MoaD family protein
VAAVSVRLASLLHSYTGGRSSLEVEAATVGDALVEIDRRYPGIMFRIIDEQRQIRPHMNVFVNENNMRGLDTVLSDGDEIYVVGALSGG